jgi:penicillin-binding protein 2
MNAFDVHRGDNPRIRLLLLLIAGASALLLMGLAWQQLIAGRVYLEMEQRQTLRQILLPGPRADILDREGRLLAGNRPLFSAVIYLDDIRPDFRREYSRLLREVREQLADGELPDYAELQWQARLAVVQSHVDQVDAITGRQTEFPLRALIRHFNERLLLPLNLVSDLNGNEYARLIEQLPTQSPIQIHADSTRFYPHGSLAAHVLGFVTLEDPVDDPIMDPNIKTFTFQAKRGRTGLERSFDERLQGQTGAEVWRVDPLGFQDLRLSLIPPRQSPALITSLDLDLQQAAESALENRRGAAIAIDVRSGEVLAMASGPGYDANRLTPFIPRSVSEEIDAAGGWLNRAIQLGYPPGSTFKLLTAMAGLRTETLHEQDEVHCPGLHRVGNRLFYCHNRAGCGTVDLARSLQVSCNVYYYVAGLRAGINAIAAEARRFGLDRRTDIELPFETGRTIIPDPDWKRADGRGSWFPGDTANTSIGQGFLLVTPLQMATFAASLARGETRTKPTILSLSPEEATTRDHGGARINLPATEMAALYAGMERAVGPGGTGRMAAVPGLRIGGKTGTAQFRADGQNINLAWFIGFAPIDDPRIAVCVLIEGERPGQALAGGSTAGPVARLLFETYKEKYLSSER